MFAILDFWDMGIIAAIVILFAGGSAAAYHFRPSDRVRLRRLEDKVDLILTHLRLEYKDVHKPGDVSAEVKALADNPANKIAAIGLHREQTGASLVEAKAAVEAYMDGRA